MPKKTSTVARLVNSSAPEPAPAPNTTASSHAPLVGECIDARHPELAGRVRVRWVAPDGPVERWVPALRGVAIRERDRVLLLATANELEPIVIGVIDGFEPREAERRAGPSVALAVDETFTLVAENGAPLLEIVRSADGPVVRLLHADTQLELLGKLRIQATEIELMARRGSVHIEADDDVTIQGEMVRLN
jgi:hypothetical protein